MGKGWAAWSDCRNRKKRLVRNSGGFNYDQDERIAQGMANHPELTAIALDQCFLRRELGRLLRFIRRIWTEFFITGLATHKT